MFICHVSSQNQHFTSNLVALPICLLQDPASPLAVYPTFIGRSCYERVLPSASVDLAFSFTTLQW